MFFLLSRDLAEKTKGSKITDERGKSPVFTSERLITPVDSRLIDRLDGNHFVHPKLFERANCASADTISNTTWRLWYGRIIVS
jgi:hypothetical protein